MRIELQPNNNGSIFVPRNFPSKGEKKQNNFLLYFLPIISEGIIREFAHIKTGREIMDEKIQVFFKLGNFTIQPNNKKNRNY